jgi:hypothetical protein
VRTGVYKPTPCEGGGPGVGSDRDACLAAGCWYFANSAPRERCVKTPRTRRVEACPGGSPVPSDRDACEDADCLWFDGWSRPDAPACQAARYQQEGKGRPARIPMLRPGVAGSDCGWSSMSPAECGKRGCDWRQPTNGDAYAPWCVYR